MNTTHSTRPAGAPAYFLGRPAAVWQIALRRQRRRGDDASPITDTRPSGRQPARSNAMKVPFNILDFLDRAQHVYGDRIGVVDEPTSPSTAGDS